MGYKIYLLFTRVFNVQHCLFISIYLHKETSYFQLKRPPCFAPDPKVLIPLHWLLLVYLRLEYLIEVYVIRSTTGYVLSPLSFLINVRAY